MSRKSDVPQLSSNQIGDIETMLNTNKQGTDAIIASKFASGQDVQFRKQVKSFIIKKKEEISELCQKYSEKFGQSIDGARTLGVNAKDIQDRVQQIESQLDDHLGTYQRFIEEAVRVRQQIRECDYQLQATTEFTILIQELKNINEEIAAGNLYIATIRTLEFANSDIPITNCSIVQNLMADVDGIIEYIEKLSDEKLSKWISNFNTDCPKIGGEFLEGNDNVEIDLSPVYEAYKIQELLGKQHKFSKMYASKRKIQLNILLERDRRTDFIDRLFNIIAGFFYCEFKISSDGYNIFPQSKLAKRWSNAINYAKRELTQRIATDKVEEMIIMAQKIAHFEERMSICSMDCSELLSSITDRSATFRKSLQKSACNAINALISNSTCEIAIFCCMEDAEPAIKYQLSNVPSRFPAEQKFIPELMDVCRIIDETLKKWVEFSAGNVDSQVNDMYGIIVRSFFNSMKSAIQKCSQIPFCGNLIGSLTAFEGALNYFEALIIKILPSNVKHDKEKIKFDLHQVQHVGASRLADLFAKFSDEMIDTDFMKMVADEPPPHTNATQLIMYFETMAGIIQSEMPPAIFQEAVEGVARHLTENFVRIIIGMDRLAWTPDYISAVAQNVAFIGNWSILISIPSAKSHLNGLIKMLNLLLSSQLSTLSSDPQFIARNQDIPYDAMVAILLRYNPTSKKGANVIQPALLRSLIQKFAPSCRDQKIIAATAPYRT